MEKRACNALRSNVDERALKLHERLSEKSNNQWELLAGHESKVPTQTYLHTHPSERSTGAPVSFSYRVRKRPSGVF